MEQPALVVQVPQPPPDAQHPGILVGPEDPQGPSMGAAVPGVPSNATTPPMGQPAMGVQLPQPPPDAQHPGMMVGPGGSQGSSVGVALPGMSYNATEPPKGQPQRFTQTFNGVQYYTPEFDLDQKWKSDELLGDQGDTSMILYSNKNHPNLKIEYPNFDDRIKQIAKIWRNLQPNKRRPYQTLARENHRAICINWQVILFLSKMPLSVSNCCQIIVLQALWLFTSYVYKRRVYIGS